MQDLYCTDPTQETRARSCRLYGFYSANDLDDTGQESCGDRSSVRCVEAFDVRYSIGLEEVKRNVSHRKAQLQVSMLGKHAIDRKSAFLGA